MHSPRIAELVEMTATRLPEATALVVTGDRIAVSYRDLVRLVDDLADRLQRRGLLPGDRIGLRAGSNAEFVVSLLAASRAELIVVPLDPALPISEQRARTEAAGVRVVLVDGDVPDDQREPAPQRWRVPVGTDRNQNGLAVQLDADTALGRVTSA